MDRIVTTDYNKINSITFKFPELMNDNAEKLILEQHKEIIQLEEELHSLRDLVRETEQKLSLLKKDWNKKSELCNIEYCTNITTYKKDKCNIGISGCDNTAY